MYFGTLIDDDWLVEQVRHNRLICWRPVDTNCYGRNCLNNNQIADSEALRLVDVDELGEAEANIFTLALFDGAMARFGKVASVPMVWLLMV